MIEQERAEEEFMLKVVRGLIDKHGPIGLWEEFNAYVQRNEELQKALEHYADWVDWEDDDMGKVARTALQSIQGGDNT